jgi:hypothetical protein
MADKYSGIKHWPTPLKVLTLHRKPIVLWTSAAGSTVRQFVMHVMHPQHSTPRWIAALAASFTAARGGSKLI